MNTPDCEQHTFPQRIAIIKSIAVSPYDGVTHAKYKRLPFFKKGKGGEPDSYWSPKRTGSHREDKQIGAYYGVEALSFLDRAQGSSIIAKIINDMPPRDEWRILEYEFISTIQRPMLGLPTTVSEFRGGAL